MMQFFSSNRDYSDLQVVVGILQVNLEPWKSIFEDGQKETWMTRCPDGIQIINLFGNQPSYLLNKADQIHEFIRLQPLGNGITTKFDGLISRVLKNREIPDWDIVKDGCTVKMYSKVSSTYVTQVIREFSLFKYFIESTNARFLYMTNTSSYINLSLLLATLRNFPSQKVSGGTFLKFDNFYFGSGANRIFSRDVVELLLTKFNEVDYHLLNDVAIGKLLYKYNFHQVHIPSLSFETEDEILKTDLDELHKTVHFRLKSGNLKSRNDTNLMKLIHSVLEG